MGVDTKRAPPLPAPTETETTTPTELTTDVSKPGDEKSSYSIPDDGTPVTIRTRGHKANRSQTSLLIEYFEGSKSAAPGSASGAERKPSVRVRLTPSRKGKGDHIQVTETKGSRKASLTRRIPLDQDLTSREIDLAEGEDASSMTSYASQTEESNVSRNPIDIEIDRGHRRHRPKSPLIPSNVSFQPVNASEISAIPDNSFLDGSGGATELNRASSPSRGEVLATAAGAGALAAYAMDRNESGKSKSGTRERVKVSDKSRDKSDKKRRSKSRTSSVSEQNVDEVRSPRRRTSRGHQESAVSGAESSLLSSGVSHTNRSIDTHSMRSGASKSSINNPKLLETVEDAIRRLILPELSALKREQSKRETRRSSLTSTGTSVSREDVTPDRRRSSGQRSDVTRESKHKSRRNREARHDYEDNSPMSISRESLREDYEDYEEDPVTPRRGGDLLKAAAAGAALSKGLSLADDATQSEDRKQRERRRRRTDSSRSRSLGRERYAEEYDDEYSAPPPPMPLMSDINPSDITRTSILSADTDRPHSASEEMGNATSRGLGSDLSAPTSLQQTLGTGHANVSHGDLTALPRGNKEEFVEYEADEYGRKVPLGRRDEYPDDDAHDYPEDNEFAERFEDDYYSVQDVPPPLKYVPYQAGARGLSPIPSVSGYTEGGSEAQQHRNSRSLHSASDIYPSPDKELERGAHGGSAHSLNSVPSNMRSREFDQLSADDRSVRSAADNRNTMYTEDSELGPMAAGQAVRGIGANPNIIHQPSGVESAVASLVDGSVIDQSVLTSGSGQDYLAARGSLSNDQSQSSRGASPEKQMDSRPREFLEERHATPSARSQDQSQTYSEYELDEYGRKVQQAGRYRQSPTASEVEITSGAVAAVAAAAALKKLQDRRQPTVEDATEHDGKFVPAGVNRNKSFKQRTLDVGDPRATPAHSIDRFSYDDTPYAGASAIPDSDYPMPELVGLEKGMGPSSVTTHDPSEADEDAAYSGRGTPTQRSFGQYTQETPNKASSGSSRGLGLAEAAAMGAVMGAGVGMASAHSREPSQDQEYWQRTSHDGKRDTLVTNPYEDASPIVNPALNENLLNRGLNATYGVPYHTGSPGFGNKYDEGYLSQDQNRTPDIEPKNKAVAFPSGVGLVDNEDPFVVSKGNARQLSGMSQGMASPFYDASTGTGIDRIENKDIVALMQHLMVRDAQRSARDTEIVALLMNAALEMRNSFREIQELIQDTGDDVVFAGVENTEKIQKSLNGTRPYPGTASRSIQSASLPATIDDVNAKKKNLWKRALAGLSAKGTNDLSRIEDMLMQLLGEVDVLKTQTAHPASISTHGQSFENLQPEGQYEQDRGYEPEGVSTASHASQSGHLSIPQSKGPTSRLANERKFSDHRISTVEEHEDEYNEYGHPSPTAEANNPNLLSAAQPEGAARGGSVPPDSPLRPSLSQQQTQSADNTPRTERGKKHKSSSSSGWIPKISRWSETTASSVGRAFRGGGHPKKESKYSEFEGPSRSGSSLGSYEHGYEHDPYDDKLHTGFSDPNLTQSAGAPASSGPPPTSIPEDPKYKAHRNSINLQHPQPRTGQTEHFRALEYSAQEYDQPDTPRSADWADSATSLHRLPQNSNSNRYSNASSAAAREGEYYPSSEGGQSAPPRPPKEPIVGQSLQSPRSNRVSRLQKGSPLQNQTYEPGYGQSSGPASPNPGSPRLENRNLSGALGAPTRRPSGPRAMTPKSPAEEAAREERRRKRDTFGTVASQDTDTF